MFFKKTDKDEDYFSYENGKFFPRKEIINELSLEIQRLKNANKIFLSNGSCELWQVVAMLLDYLELDVQESKTRLVKRNEETK
jgi:hypothetical protein